MPLELDSVLDECDLPTMYVASLLRERLQGANSPAKPYVFDIRGGGLFWGIEFDLDTDEAKNAVDLKGESFAMLVQALALEKGLVIMGFAGGSNLEGNKGSHVLLSPAYNVTKNEVEKIVDILVESIEEVLVQHKI